MFFWKWKSNSAQQPKQPVPTHGFGWFCFGGGILGGPQKPSVEDWHLASTLQFVLSIFFSFLHLFLCIFSLPLKPAELST